MFVSGEGAEEALLVKVFVCGRGRGCCSAEIGEGWKGG